MFLVLLILFPRQVHLKYRMKSLNPQVAPLLKDAFEG